MSLGLTLKAFWMKKSVMTDMNAGVGAAISALLSSMPNSSMFLTSWWSFKCGYERPAMARAASAGRKPGNKKKK